MGWMDKHRQTTCGFVVVMFLTSFLPRDALSPWAGTWFAGLVLCSVQVVKDLHGLVRLDLTEDFHHLVKQLERIFPKHREIDAMLSITFRTLVI